MRKEEVFWFHTGSDLLDLVTGGGLGFGMPSGRIVNIVGDKSAGKSAVACEIIAAAFYALKNRFKWVYDDCESGLTHDTKSIYGFDVVPEKEKDRVKSRTVEELYCNYRQFLESLKESQFGIYVVDSLDGLSSDEIEGIGNERYKKFKKGESLDKGSYQMGSAKFLSQQFFRSLVSMTEERNCLLIIISQVRDDINAIGPFRKQRRSGGKALDFYAYACIWLANVSKEKKKGRTVGVVIRARAEKSKTPRPYRDCVFPIYFDYGIDNIGANIDFLYDLRGDSYKLLPSKTKNISWGDSEGRKFTIGELKDFLNERDLLAVYTDSVRDREFNKKHEKIEAMIGFIQDQNDETSSAYNKMFGQTFTREELIAYIEQNNLQKGLTDKVRDKWEAIEDEIKVKRTPKYRG